MRSIKGIIIGFLLILLGFAVTSYSLIAGGVLAAAGLAAVVIFALPKKTAAAAGGTAARVSRTGARATPRRSSGPRPCRTS